MDRQQGRSDASVEAILADLHRSGKVGGDPKELDVNDILAGIHKSSSKNVKASLPHQVAPRAQQPLQAQPSHQQPPDISEQRNESEQAVQESVAVPSPIVEPESTRRLPRLSNVEGDDTAPAPRVGKAAAMERVQADKYVGDAELSQWFVGNEEQHLSPREQKRLEKERKRDEKQAIKEEKMALKEEKRLARKNKRSGEQDELFLEEDGFFEAESAEWPEGFAPQVTVVQPEDGGRELQEAFAEIQNTPNDLPPREHTQAPEIQGEGISLLEFAQLSAQTPATPEVKTKPAPVPTAPVSPVPTAPVGGMSFGGVAAVAPKVATQTAAQPVPQQSTRAFTVPSTPKEDVSSDSTDTQVLVSPDIMQKELEQGAAFLAAASVTGTFPKPLPPNVQGKVNTKRFDIDGRENERVPTAAYTQEFENKSGTQLEQKSLFVDEMVDDRFRQFFGETVIVEQDEEELVKPRQRRKQKKNRTTLLTGEFSQFVLPVGQEEEEVEDDDYNNPQDAQAVEHDLNVLKKSLMYRSIISAVGVLLLLWFSLGFSNVLPLPEFLNPQLSPLLFALAYVGVFVAVLVINFTTVASGIIGLFGEATSDSAVAVASVAALLQAVVLGVLLIGGAASTVSLFAPVAALLLSTNAFGKQLRCGAILESFRLASSGQEQSAAYVLEGGGDVAYHVTRGLEEEAPTILVSRPTALMKGFLRQSFSRRQSDVTAKKMAWVCLAVSLLCLLLGFVFGGDLVMALSAFAGAACVIAPLSSSLLAAVPAMMLQQAGDRFGVVVPGWSAIEELGNVNVVMAEAKDIFPPSSVTLKGIKTFEQERIDLAILYAASILTENCDTMQDVFLGVIQGKKDMLFKVENLLCEVGRGFVGFVDNSRVVVGTREMLQVHDIDPPPLEMEMKLCSGSNVPLYLAVSGKLFAMFLIEYTPEAGVRGTLYGLLRSGVSMLVHSKDPCVSGDLIERVYQLPKGVVKVLDKNEEHLMEPLRSYLPESEGVMSHLGTFSSFIGGMRAAATCMESERMSTFVQMAGILLACVLALLLGFSGALALLSVGVVLLYQLGWSLLVGILPLARRN